MGGVLNHGEALVELLLSLGIEENRGSSRFLQELVSLPPKRIGSWRVSGRRIPDPMIDFYF